MTWADVYCLCHWCYVAKRLHYGEYGFFLLFYLSLFLLFVVYFSFILCFYFFLCLFCTSFSSSGLWCFPYTHTDDSNDTNLCSGRPINGLTTLRNGTTVVFRGESQTIIPHTQAGMDYDTMGPWARPQGRPPSIMLVVYRTIHGGVVNKSVILMQFENTHLEARASGAPWLLGPWALA